MQPLDPCRGYNNMFIKQCFQNVTYLCHPGQTNARCIRFTLFESNPILFFNLLILKFTETHMPVQKYKGEKSKLLNQTFKSIVYF